MAIEIYIISLSSELVLVKTGEKSLNFLLEYLSDPMKSNEIISHILFKDLVLIGIAEEDSVMTRIESLLIRIINLLDSYFKPLTENAIKSDFSTVYNLIMDSSLTSVNSNILFQLYPPQSILDGVKEVIMPGSNLYTVPALIIGEPDWRNPTVKYSKNQIWFDFIEKIKISSSGKTDFGEIVGELKVNCNLSGILNFKF